MLFNSFAFLVFFPVVTFFYFILPQAARWVWLLAASCFFYMYFRPVYIVILAVTILIDYVAAILIERQESKVAKKKFLVLSLVANLGILFIFKYYNFFDNSISSLLHAAHPVTPLVKLALPIGLSFHTFQAMSYTIEVYRGNQQAEKHMGIYALYVMFYPQLVAGPIERPQHLLHQFREEHAFDYGRVVSGLKLMMLGMFKKVVIADRLADITDHVYQVPLKYNGITTLIAVIFFSIQIYCDFSGYSDIAIGSARVMGFRLMRNFDAPYISGSITQFWRRWHISLSTWFRDYVFIPLGGSRVPPARWVFNILVVFLLSGLWHGAAWTFLVWGLLHACFYIGERILTTGKRKNENRAGARVFISWLVTFTCVTLAWIFFRAGTVEKAGQVFRSLLRLPSDIRHFSYTSFVANIPTSVFRLMIAAVLIILLLLSDRYKALPQLNSLLKRQPRYLRWLAYYTIILLIIFLGFFENRRFIYFQF